MAQMYKENTLGNFVARVFDVATKNLQYTDHLTDLKGVARGTYIIYILAGSVPTKKRKNKTSSQ